MKFKPGELVKITRSINVEPVAKLEIDTIEEYIGCLGIVVRYNKKGSYYDILIQNVDDYVDVYEEEIELV